jgi:hypothetical protein
MASLELSATSKLGIIDGFWGATLTDLQKDQFDGSAYCEYFKEQFRLARQSDEPSCQIYTLPTICNIVCQLKAGIERKDITVELLKQYAGAGKQANDHINNAVNLAIRLWLMIHVGSREGITGQTAIPWLGGCLQDVVTEHFCYQLVLTDSVKFEKVFNALNLERIAGVVIQWTPNLVDHLRLKEDGKRPILNIFHHTAFLQYHRDW